MLVPIESAFNLPEDTLTFSHTHIHLNFVHLFFFFGDYMPSGNPIASLLAFSKVVVFRQRG